MKSYNPRRLGIVRKTLCGLVAIASAAGLVGCGSKDIKPINHVPVLESIDNKEVNENENLSFFINANDEDGNELIYSAQDLPSGANFNPNTKEFSWTPNFEQSGSYDVCFRVSDGELEDTETVTVNVNNVNRSANFSGIIPDQNWDEDTSLNDAINLNNYFSDPDGDNLVFGVSGNNNIDVAIDKDGYVSCFQPADWNGSENVVFNASDGGEIVNSSSVGLSVNSVNDAPVLDHLEDIVANERDLVIIPLSATDIEGDFLTYMLENAPDGMEINPSTNEIEWQTTYADAGDHIVTARVYDDSKDVILVNVGSGGSVLVDVGGTTGVIAGGSTEIVNGIEITVIDTFYASHKADRAALLEIESRGECFFDIGDSVLAYDGETDSQDVNIRINNVPCYKIAFQSYIDGNAEICKMNEDGSGKEQLTDNPALDCNQRLSPDGTKIAFASMRDGNQEMYLMNSDGTNQQNLSNSPTDDGAPYWSPDGTKITFYTMRDGNAEIYKISPDGSGLENLTNNPANEGIVFWSPDGTKIYFVSDESGGRNLYRMNPDGSGIEQITNNTYNDFAYMMSPDGTQIAFQSDRDGDEEIYTMDKEGVLLQKLTDNLAYDCYPKWSPDGSKVIFYSQRTGDHEIFRINPNGSGLERLTDNPGVHDMDPHYSPDGQKIVYVSGEVWPGNLDVWVMDADSSNKIQLTDNFDWDGQPRWSPNKE